jgi:hypothetical protein
MLLRRVFPGALLVIMSASTLAVAIVAFKISVGVRRNRRSGRGNAVFACIHEYCTSVARLARRGPVWKGQLK